VIRAFLSYSSLDKELAGRIKANLVEYGINAFLAHEDIRPSSKWQRTIVSNLRRCEVFIPIITKNFAKSSWTDQEAGFAMCRKVLVIPVSVDAIPYGFLNVYQAAKLDPDHLDAGIHRIVLAVCRRSRFRPRVLDGLVSAFATSESFEQGKMNAQTLEEFDGYSPKQLKAIFAAFVDNYENRSSFGAQRVIRRLLNAHASDVSAATARRVKNALQ